eukprot:7188960-Prorocentrum_lima.AAC.1
MGTAAKAPRTRESGGRTPSERCKPRETFAREKHRCVERRRLLEKGQRQHFDSDFSYIYAL